MDRRSLAVCAIFKNEAPYLLEWIAYHRVIGFDRFVLYDNGSTDGGADLIRSSPLADRVTVIHWPQRPGQLTAYRHFIDIFAPAYDWVAFIDLDEFILPLDGATLQDTLRRCVQASAVLVNWRVFGPAGHEQPPPGLVIEAYDLRAEDGLPVNRHVKSIVRCADLMDVTQNPHAFRLKGPVCNPLGLEVPNITVQQAACHHGLVINHYYTRSRPEWLAKVHRGSAMFDDTGPQYTEDVFEHLAAACYVKDETIKAYAPQVRALLAGGTVGSGAPLPESVAPPPADAAVPSPPAPPPAAAWPAAPPLAATPPAATPPAATPPAALPLAAPPLADAVAAAPPSADAVAAFSFAPAAELVPTTPAVVPETIVAAPAAEPPLGTERLAAPAPSAAPTWPATFLSPTFQLPAGSAPTNPASPPAAEPGAAMPHAPAQIVPPLPAQMVPPAPAQMVPPAPGWLPMGSDAQEHAGGLALVFRDRSRAAAPWLAALRGKAAGLVDPEFLLDEAGRLRDFPTDQQARAACDAALAEYRVG